MNFNKITLAALMALLFTACSDESGSLGSMGGWCGGGILKV